MTGGLTPRVAKKLSSQRRSGLIARRECPFGRACGLPRSTHEQIERRAAVRTVLRCLMRQ